MSLRDLDFSLTQRLVYMVIVLLVILFIKEWLSTGSTLDYD